MAKLYAALSLAGGEVGGISSFGSKLRSNCSRAESWRRYGGRFTFSRNERVTIKPLAQLLRRRHFWPSTPTWSTTGMTKRESATDCTWRRREAWMRSLHTGRREASHQGMWLRGCTYGSPYICCMRRCFNSFAHSSMARAMMLTTTLKQTSVPNSVQGTTTMPTPHVFAAHTHGRLAMGLPQQTEPRAQEPSPRRPPTPAMGTELHSEGHGGYSAG
jgi:hypothetical protein